jgi:hypothetical protein
VERYERIAVNGYKNGKFAISKTVRREPEEIGLERVFQSEFEEDRRYKKQSLSIEKIEAQFWVRGYFVSVGNWVETDDSKPMGSIKRSEHVSVQRGYHIYITVEADIALSNGATLHKKGDIASNISPSDITDNITDVRNLCENYTSKILPKIGIVCLPELAVFKINHSDNFIDEFFLKSASKVDIQKEFMQILAFAI